MITQPMCVYVCRAESNPVSLISSFYGAFSCLFVMPCLISAGPKYPTRHHLVQGLKLFFLGIVIFEFSFSTRGDQKNL